MNSLLQPLFIALAELPMNALHLFLNNNLQISYYYQTTREEIRKILQILCYHSNKFDYLTYFTTYYLLYYIFIFTCILPHSLSLTLSSTLSHSLSYILAYCPIRTLMISHIFSLTLFHVHSHSLTLCNFRQEGISRFIISMVIIDFYNAYNAYVIQYVYI